MTSRRIKEDLYRAAENYRLLAEIILNIKGSALAKDANFVAQLEGLRDAMAEYAKQIQCLAKAISKAETTQDFKRPVLRLVKR